MADITVTAASVATSTGAVLNKDYTAGEAITAGQSVYLNASNIWMKAKNESTALVAGSGGFGIALHTSASGQPLVVQTGGNITMGATLVAGQVYAISSTFGGICPIADVIADTTSYMTYLGYATTTGVLSMTMAKYTGIAVA